MNLHTFFELVFNKTEHYLIRVCAVLTLTVALCTSLSAQTVQSFEFKTPGLVLTDVNFSLEIIAQDSGGLPVSSFTDSVLISGVQHNVLGKVSPAIAYFSGGRAKVEDLVITRSGPAEIGVSHDGLSVSTQVRVIPGLLSILPPLLAIVLALALRQVVISLFAGIWLGAVFIFDYNVVSSIFRVLDHFIVNALTETSHVQIIVFSMMFGGMVGIISNNGGTIGIANLLTRYAKTSRGGQLATLFMAFVMFFDDYANVLVRGNLMRPITDKLRVSREKLSFIVDAGAATVASVFIISTWIGYEVGLIEQGLKSINSSQDAYSVFLQTIPYRFYPILTLVFVFLVGWMKRDFGPMLTAERRARSTGEVLREGSQPATDLTESTDSFASDKPPRWYNGLLPILSILVVGLYRLYATGTAALEAEGISSYSIGEIISKSDSYGALMWASLSGCLVAVLLSVGQRILTLVKAIDAWFTGLKAMLLAMLILILAWSIGSVTQELHTAEYLVQILRGTIAPHWLPVLVFLIAAGVSFATGTSWGTMAIMMPLVIPLGHTLSLDAQLTGAGYDVILHGVISSVLAGAVFGDHCSPISDTTILSSMASACDHIDHVRTQLPYAVLVAIVGMAVGNIPTAFGLSPWVSIIAGTAVMTAVLYFFGKKVE